MILLTPLAWDFFVQKIEEDFFRYGKEVYFARKLYAQGTASPDDLLQFGMKRSDLIADLPFYAEQKRLLFLMGSLPSTLEELRIRYPQITTMDYRDLVSLFSTFSKRRAVDLDSDEDTASEKGGSTVKKSRGGRSKPAKGGTDQTDRNKSPEDQYANISSARLKHLKDRWLQKKGHKACRYCEKDGQGAPDCNHFYLECPRNPSVRHLLTRFGAFRVTPDLHSPTVFPDSLMVPTASASSQPPYSVSSSSSGTTVISDSSTAILVAVSQPPVVEFKESLDEVDETARYASCKMFTCRLGVSTFLALEDTGSPFNFISPELASKLNMTLYKSRVAIPVSGRLKRSLVEIVDRFVKIKLAGKTHAFYVLSVAFDMILGQPFLCSASGSDLSDFSWRKAPSPTALTKFRDAKMKDPRPQPLACGSRLCHTSHIVDTFVIPGDLPFAGKVSLAAMAMKDEVDKLPAQIQPLAAQFPAVFSPDRSVPPNERLVQEFSFTIEFKGQDRPKPRAAYCIDADTETLLRETLKSDLDSGKIVSYRSPFAAPCFFVPKKPNSKRMVIDYQALNAVAVPDA